MSMRWLYTHACTWGFSQEDNLCVLLELYFRWSWFGSHLCGWCSGQNSDLSLSPNLSVPAAQFHFSRAGLKIEALHFLILCRCLRLSTCLSTGWLIYFFITTWKFRWNWKFSTRKIEHCQGVPGIYHLYYIYCLNFSPWNFPPFAK